MNFFSEKERQGEHTQEGRRKLMDHIVPLYLIAMALIFLGQILGMRIEPLLPFDRGTDVAVTAGLYFSMIGIWVMTLFYLRFTKKNCPILKAVGTKTAGNNWKNLLLGFMIGFGMNGICVLIAWLHGDISLVYDSFRPGSFLIVFFAVFIQSSAEELVCRGFLYQRLRKSYKNPAVAVVANSMLFALLHLMNEGITALSVLNIFLVGILFSFIVYYMDSLWCAMAAHAAWNFMQNIIFGLPNSGIVLPYSVFKLDAATASSSFAYDVGFGIEGTVTAAFVLTLACACIWMWGRKYGRKPTEIWYGFQE